MLNKNGSYFTLCQRLPRFIKAWLSQDAQTCVKVSVSVSVKQRSALLNGVRLAQAWSEYLPRPSIDDIIERVGQLIGRRWLARLTKWPQIAVIQSDHTSGKS